MIMKTGRKDMYQNIAHRYHWFHQVEKTLVANESTLNNAINSRNHTEWLLLVRPRGVLEVCLRYIYCFISQSVTRSGLSSTNDFRILYNRSENPQFGYRTYLAGIPWSERSAALPFRKFFSSTFLPCSSNPSGTFTFWRFLHLQSLTQRPLKYSNQEQYPRRTSKCQHLCKRSRNQKSPNVRTRNKTPTFLKIVNSPRDIAFSFSDPRRKPDACFSSFSRRVRTFVFLFISLPILFFFLDAGSSSRSCVFVWRHPRSPFEAHTERNVPPWRGQRMLPMRYQTLCYESLSINNFLSFSKIDI